MLKAKKKKAWGLTFFFKDLLLMDKAVSITKKKKEHCGKNY